MAQATIVRPDPGSQSPALWAGVIGAPAAWSLQMVAGYALTEHACANTWSYLTLHLLTLAFAVVAAACGWVSWRAYRRVGGGSPDEIDGGPVPRERFLGFLGAGLSALSVVVILAQGVPSFFFDGCWR